MRRPLLLALFASTVAVAACHDGAPTGARLLGIVPATDSVVGTASEYELHVAKARWADARDGRDYSFVTYMFCFCMAEVSTPVRVQVHGSAVTSVREVGTGNARPVEQYYTIEQLFDRAIEFRASDRPVRATYAAGSWYPMWLTLGTPENDAGTTYRVESVRLE